VCHAVKKAIKHHHYLYGVKNRCEGSEFCAKFYFSVIFNLYFGDFLKVIDNQIIKLLPDYANIQLSI
jgi:hypothetical protein